MDNEQENDDLSFEEAYGLPVAGEPMAQPVSEHNEGSNLRHEATETPEQEAAETPAQQVAEGEAISEANGDFAPLIEAMKAQGFTSMDDIHAAMAQQQAEAMVGQELASYQAQLQARIDQGTLDPQDAEEMFNLKASALEAQAQAQAQQAALAMQQQQQAAQALSKLDPALAQAAQQIGLTPEQIAALAPVLEQVTGKVSQKAVSEYVAQKGQGGTVAPIPQGASAAPADSDINEDEFSFGDLVQAGKFK